MSPILIAALAAGAGSALANAGTLMPSDLAKSNKARLEELKRKEEMGALGLTTKEQAAMENRLRGGQQRIADAAQFERERLLAGSGGAQAGASLAQAAQAEQTQMAMETDIANKVLEQDLLKEAQQVDEMRALEAAVDQRKRELTSAIAGIGGAALQGGMATSAQQAIIQGQKDISPTAVAGLANQLGVSNEEARGLYELSITNPEMFKYLTALQGS
jgi:hypothetical protein